RWRRRGWRWLPRRPARGRQSIREGNAARGPRTTTGGQFRRHAGTCSIDAGVSLSVPFICRDPRLISGLARLRLLPIPGGWSVSLPLRGVAAAVLVAAAPLA